MFWKSGRRSLPALGGAGLTRTGAPRPRMAAVRSRSDRAGAPALAGRGRPHARFPTKLHNARSRRTPPSRPPSAPPRPARSAPPRRGGCAHPRADRAGQAFLDVLERREGELLHAGVRLDAVAAAFGPVAVAVERHALDVAGAPRPERELEDRPCLFEFGVLQRVAGRAFGREPDLGDVDRLLRGRVRRFDQVPVAQDRARARPGAAVGVARDAVDVGERRGVLRPRFAPGVRGVVAAVPGGELERARGAEVGDQRFVHFDQQVRVAFAVALRFRAAAPEPAAAGLVEHLDRVHVRVRPHELDDLFDVGPVVEPAHACARVRAGLVGDHFQADRFPRCQLGRRVEPDHRADMLDVAGFA